MPDPITEADLDAVRAGIDGIDYRHERICGHPALRASPFFLCDCEAQSATLSDLLGKLSALLPTHHEDGEGSTDQADRG